VQLHNRFQVPFKRLVKAGVLVPQIHCVGTPMLKHAKEADTVPNRADCILRWLFQVLQHTEPCQWGFIPSRFICSHGRL